MTTEEDVAIRAWTNDLSGFTGILKQRYSDFRVNELTAAGEVVRLTNMQPVTGPAAKTQPEQRGEPTANAAQPAEKEYPAEDVEAALKHFAVLAGEENAAILRGFVSAILSHAARASAARAATNANTATSSAPSASHNNPQQPGIATPNAGATGGTSATVPGQGMAASAAPAAEIATPAATATARETADPAAAAADPALSAKPVATAPIATSPEAASDTNAAYARTRNLGDAANETGADSSAAGAAAAEAGGSKPSAEAGGSKPSAEAGRNERRQPPPPKSVVLREIPQKQKRGAVHGFFKTETRLPQMRTETVTTWSDTGKDQAPAAGAIQVTHVRPSGKRKRGGGGGGSGVRHDDWPDGERRKYVRFVMRKENLDTHAAIGILVRSLHASPAAFAFAGTKDKRAVTEQAVTAFKVSDRRLSALNTYLKGIQIGNFEYVGHATGLGAAGGNQFDLVLRDVGGATPDQVVAAVQGLAANGFVNYYGLQRFGVGASNATHMVGAELLKGNWELAVHKILAGPVADRADIAAARAAFTERGDINAALQGFPRHFTAERSILETLKRHGPKAWLTALENIPRNLRSMYAHAYQSYLWNAAATHRIERYGATAVVEGDLVLPASNTAGDADEFGEGPAAAAGRTQGRLDAVHIVTAAEAAAGAFDMEDVVLPLLPGTRVQLPTHETAQVYEDFAARDGIDLRESPHNVRGFSVTGLAGDYRRLVQRPKRLAWRLLRYTDPSAELSTVSSEGSDGVSVESASATFYADDTAQLAHVPGAPEQGTKRHKPSSEAAIAQDGSSKAATSAAATDSRVAASINGSSGAAADGGSGGSRDGIRGSRLALQLRFQLPPSAYATMAVRQMTKQSTMTEVHRNSTLAVAAAAGSSGAAAAQEGTVAAAASAGA